MTCLGPDQASRGAQHVNRDQKGRLGVLQEENN